MDAADLLSDLVAVGVLDPAQDVVVRRAELVINAHLRPVLTHQSPLCLSTLTELAAHLARVTVRELLERQYEPVVQVRQALWAVAHGPLLAMSQSSIGWEHGRHHTTVRHAVRKAATCPRVARWRDEITTAALLRWPEAREWMP